MILETIYGANISFHEPKQDIYVEDWGFPNEPKKQYWRRKEIPSFFDNVETTKEGDLLLTDEQDKYATEEARRCKNGFYFMNKGNITYISPKHYFYLQWWKLEDDIHPDYRDTDRRYFHFLSYWENIPWCLGILRGKKRREGASSQATSNLIYECIFFKNSICGLVSKTEKDSKITFLNMVAFGYRQLPIFFKPKQLNSPDSVTEFVFAHKSSSSKDGNVKVIDNDTGHRSRIDYRAPGVNTYDSGRLSRGLFDEGGKWDKDKPFSTFLSIVSKTMVKGVKRVGFMECPSTINEMSKNGGEEYKAAWNSGNQFKLGLTGKTTNRLVRYFTPAYDGLYGFIDQYGMSVIDPPDEETYDYLVKNYVGIGDLTEADVRMGAKEYLTTLRVGKEGSELEEETRMNPFNEDEMFMYAGHGCHFNAGNINKALKELEETPVLLRKWALRFKDEVKKDIFGKETIRKIIAPIEDAKTGWHILEPPNKENLFEETSWGIEPSNTLNYQIGVDTTQDRIAESGSNPCIVVFKKSCKTMVNGELTEVGMYPVAIWISPTRLDIHFDEEVLKACMWYGCMANYEVDRRTDFIFYFRKKAAARFLNWTPKVFQNPNKRGGFKPEVGSRSGDAFQLAQQLSICKMYVDGDSIDYYNGNVEKIKFPTLLNELLKYDHNDRTKSDQVVALMMALAPVYGEMQNPIIPREVKQLFPTYKLKIS